MKYFYQQLVGFLSVVLVSVVVCGLLFYNVMTNKIFMQRSQQLFGYAKAILVNDLTAEQINSSLSLLKDEHLGVAIFDKENKMTYPATVLNVKSSLTDEELQHLQDGSAINMKQTKHNFVGEAADLVTIYYPIFKDQTYTGFLAISSPLSRIETEMAELKNSILVGFSSAAVAGVILSVLFANYQTRRINRLRKATHEIAEGNYDISLPTQKRDEFDDLVMDFNKMAESLQKSEQEIERQENLRRQLMMDVAHEMRTPLTTMNGLLEGLIHHMIPESRRERSLELITNETQRLIRLVNENLDYEKIRSDQIVLVKQNFSGAEALQNVVSNVNRLVEAQKVSELELLLSEVKQISLDIKQGQKDDRRSKILGAESTIEQALLMSDENPQKEHLLLNAINQLNEGRASIIKEFEGVVAKNLSIPKTNLFLFLKSIVDDKFNEDVSNSFVELNDQFSYIVKASDLLAKIYTVTGNNGLINTVYAPVKNLIENNHEYISKLVELQEISAEEQRRLKWCIEPNDFIGKIGATELSDDDIITIEFSGQELLKGVKDG